MLEVTRKLNSTINLEEKLKQWSKGPGKAEEQMCSNAESFVKNAISAHPRLKNMNLRVFAKGSYRNRTNISKISDVDICVMHKDIFVAEYPEGKSAKDFGFTSASLNFTEFKNLIYEALVSYVNNQGDVTPGDMAICLNDNTYRVNADVVPAFRHVLYNNYQDTYGDYQVRAEGMAIYSNKKSEWIYNWPDQNYENGKDKNDKTSRMYKRVVRILKNVKKELLANNINLNVSSFLIESLVYNVPREKFHTGNYIATTRSVLAHIFNNLLDSKFNREDWVEVNNIKYLFHSDQQWSRDDALAFIDKSWDFLGFE